MNSSLGWQELSQADLRRLRQELENKGTGVRDEMGVLALHVGYGDLFFPGTSVLHTRPRYLFFTCWNFLKLKKDADVNSSNASRCFGDLEFWVTDKLLQENPGGPRKTRRFVIGERIHPDKRPAQPPVANYWTALKKYGFYRGPSSGALLSRWRPELIGEVTDTRSLAREEGHNFQAIFHVPGMPRNWGGKNSHSDLTLDLEREEAEFLQLQLKSIQPACVLSEAAAAISSYKDELNESFWNDPLILSIAKGLGQADSVLRAKHTSAMAELIRATYAALVEQTCLELGAGAIEPSYVEYLEGYWTSKDRSSLLEDALRLDVAKLQVDIPKLAPDFIQLLNHLQSRLKAVKRPTEIMGRLLDKETRALFEKVERQRKGRRARLPKTPLGAERRAGFNGETLSIRGLHFRWEQVRQMLNDIRDGLKRRRT